MAGFSPVVVVLGAEAERVRDVVDLRDIHVAENPEWEAGMGSSLVCGLRKLLAIKPDIAAVALSLGDQPLVTAEHLSAMNRQRMTGGAEMIAAFFAGTLGSPAIFDCSTFAVLLQLSPEAGAKRLFRNPAWRTEPFALPEAAVDVDTPDDLSRLESINQALSQDVPRRHV